MHKQTIYLLVILYISFFFSFQPPLGHGHVDAKSEMYGRWGVEKKGDGLRSSPWFIYFYFFPFFFFLFFKVYFIFRYFINLNIKH